MARDASVDEAERLLCEAIERLHLVAFDFRGHHRIAEPHDLGIIDGDERLFFFQVGGTTGSGGKLGWRWVYNLADISNLEILSGRFAGPRPISSGRHHRWDRLIASVSRPPSKENGEGWPTGGSTRPPRRRAAPFSH